LISLLASDSLSEVDQSVVELFRAKPEGRTFSWGFHKLVSRPGVPPASSGFVELAPPGEPTFLRDVALVLSGHEAVAPLREWEHDSYLADFTGIRVTRAWRGQIVADEGASSASYYSSIGNKKGPAQSISITAEIEGEMLDRLISFTKDVLNQSDEIGQAEEKDDAR
jgi:hypothetical protein